MAQGIVYRLTNSARLDWVKIGCVTKANPDDLRKRVRGFYATGVPFPFEMRYAVVVSEPEKIEGVLHDTFANTRGNRNREFFEPEPERVIAAMQLTGGKEICLSDRSEQKIQQADIDAHNQSRQRSDKKCASFKFSLAGILPGAELTFVRNREITAEVVDDKKIEFRGEVTALSASATTILKSKHQVAAPSYWKYAGKIRTQIRRDAIDEAESADESADADVGYSSVTLQPKKWAATPKEKSSRFKFSQAGIPRGETLISSLDAHATATVMDDTTINFAGKETSLFAAARRILVHVGRPGTVSGAENWQYKDEKRTTIRIRIETEFSPVIQQ